MVKTTEKRNIGNIGEEIACRYLRSKGYLIVERNYLKKVGEIDIVSKKEGILYFIEVKTVTRENISRVTGNDAYRPEDNIHKDKIERLGRAIDFYIEERRVPDDVDWKVGFLTVKLDRYSKKAEVEFMFDIAI